MQRIEVVPLPEQPDHHGGRLAARIRSELGLAVEDVRLSRVYYVDGPVDEAQARWIADHLLADPVVNVATVNDHSDIGHDWSLEVGYKPGVTDNEGIIAAETIQAASGAIGLHPEARLTVHTSRRCYVKGEITAQDGHRIAEAMLANPLIQRIAVEAAASDSPLLPWPFTPSLPQVDRPFREVELPEGEEALLRISQDGLLALSLQEMQAIRRHFADPVTQNQRQKLGLPVWPTDVELEALAQTWSEHCKHKIFNDRIRYTDGGTTEVIDSLFATFIRGSTNEVAKSRDWLVSVFKDNAGVIAWSPTHHLVFKAETHNAPSALEPYGGALTGIVGVNRDPAGTGLGAKLIFNTDVFCFADPTWSRPLPPGVLHPRRLFDGVRQGVEDGGNQSGVPTVNGGLFFDDRYLGRPLVFCGTGALMPVTSAGRPTHDKSVHPGDLVVMAGGRVGKDGVHGATFSSQAIGAEAPVGVVQIGDPITQKKLLDMITEARELGLYRAITDNGAGGLSSSVGEMAEMSNGAVLDLDQVPLKYPGLAPWEILVSESQERMTLAVPPEDWLALQSLAARRGVEVTAVGRFTDDGRFSANWHGQPVMGLSMAFLHGGLPRRTLEAEWQPMVDTSPMPEMPADLGVELLTLLGSLNICSREGVIRQYDHEVQGGSVVKPLVGVTNDGPSDAAVLRPVLASDLGVVVSSAINPHYGDHDTYAMALLMVDEAIRNAVAVGADPDHLALLDNFCWPDPVYHPIQNPDGKHKLAQLVRACQGLYDATVAFGTPLISGKDSMKNDYHGPDGKISVPPTLLVSAVARHPDVRKSVTMDVKAPGDLVYLVGRTHRELGGSQYARQLGWSGGRVPQVNLPEAREQYRALHRAIMAELVASCHDCSEGGLAVALAEMAFAGGYGLAVRLAEVPDTGERRPDEVLFGESASRLVVTVAPGDRRVFEDVMAGHAMALIGEVCEQPTLRIDGVDGRPVVQLALETLKAAWQGGLAC